MPDGMQATRYSQKMMHVLFLIPHQRRNFLLRALITMTTLDIWLALRKAKQENSMIVLHGHNIDKKYKDYIIRN